MEYTDRYELPMIMPSQAQKHVTHNEALTLVDGVLHPAIATSGGNEPPAGAAPGELHLTGPDPAGDWSGNASRLALMTAAGWRFITPLAGFVAFFPAESRLKLFDGADWQPIAAGDALQLRALGVGAAPDPQHGVTVKSPSVLLTDVPDAEGGDGSARLVVNRESAADTASVLFQTGWNGNAEFGLCGDAAFRLKVSADGQSWSDAMAIGMDAAATFGGQVSAQGFVTSGGATVWTSGNDGAGSGLDADLWQGRPFQAVAGSATTAGTADWNAAANLTKGFASRLMQGTDANGFGQAFRYHCWNVAYGDSGYVTQIAIPWGHSGAVDSGLFIRGFYNGAWSSWRQVWTSGNDGSGSGLEADRISAFTVATLPSASQRGAGAMVYVSNESGGAVPAFSDGTNWRRVTDRAIVS